MTFTRPEFSARRFGIGEDLAKKLNLNYVV